MTFPTEIPRRSFTAQAGDVTRIAPQAEHVFHPGRSDEPDTTRRDLVRLLFKHRRLILICFVCVTAVVGLGMFLLPPTYVAGAKILIRVERQTAPSFFSGVAPLTESRAIETNARKLENEMAILESAPLSIATQKRTDMRYDQVFRAPTRFFTIPLLEQWDRIKQSLLHREVYDRRGAGAVSEMLQSSLTVRPAPSKSVEAAPDVILVALPATNPQIAEQALNVLLDEYLKFGSALNDRAGESALAVVKREASEAQSQLAAAEERLRRMRSSSGVRSNVAGTMAEDPLVARLKRELLDVQLALAAARRTFLERSDTVQYLTRSEGDIQSRLSSAATADASRAGTETELRRELLEAETRYGELRRRSDEISLYLRANIQAASDRVVIEDPVASGSSDWKRRLLFAIAGSLGGLLLGLALAAIREYVDQTLETRAAARRYLGTPPAAALPEASVEDLQYLGLSRKRGRTGSTRPPGRRSQHASARLIPRLRDLASRTASALGSIEPAPNGARAILVTSAHEGEGKTFVADALARQLAEGGFGRVLLVDAASRSDEITSTTRDTGQAVSATAAAGGNGMTLGGLLLGESWQQGALSGNELAPVRLPAGNLSQPVLFGTSRIQHFLEIAARHFDWIVIDSGSLGDLGVTQLARLTDATFLVVDSPKTRRQVVLNALRQLPEGRLGVCGVILNRQRQYIPDAFYDRA